MARRATWCARGGMLTTIRVRAKLRLGLAFWMKAASIFSAALKLVNVDPAEGDLTALNGPQLAARLQRFADLAPLVLVCHAPPYGTVLDRISPGVHAGSTAVRDFIQKYQPEYFFCGHIHEAEGASVEIGKTVARSVGKTAYLLELD